MNTSIRLAPLLLCLLSQPAHADFIYTLQRQIGSLSLTGTITTENDLGQAIVSDYRLFFSSGLILDPGNSQLLTQGGLRATPVGLFFQPWGELFYTFFTIGNVDPPYLGWLLQYCSPVDPHPRCDSEYILGVPYPHDLDKWESYQVASIPEPVTGLLVALGLLGLTGFNRR